MKKTAILSLAFALISLGLRAENNTKDINRSFAANDNVVFTVETDFSSVSIRTHNENRVDIKVHVDVTSKSAKGVTEIMDRIEVKIKEGTSAASLTIAAKSVSCGKGENFDIRVEILLPSNASLDGKVKFGNLKLDTMNGRTVAITEYGNLDADRLNHGENDVKSAFGNVNIGWFGGGKIRSEFGNLDLVSVSGNTQLTSEFGNLEVSKVEVSCTAFDAGVNYGNGKILFASAGSFEFEAMASFGNLSVPKAAEFKAAKDKGLSESAAGVYGNGNRIQVTCNSSFGNLTLGLTNR